MLANSQYNYYLFKLLNPFFSFADAVTAGYLIDVWRPKCCVEPAMEICDASEELVPSASAGYACLVNGASVEDSNFGGTSVSCAGRNGEWVEYDCSIAEGHLAYVGKF